MIIVDAGEIQQFAKIFEFNIFQFNILYFNLIEKMFQFKT